MTMLTFYNFVTKLQTSTNIIGSWIDDVRRVSTKSCLHWLKNMLSDYKQKI